MNPIKTTLFPERTRAFLATLLQPHGAMIEAHAQREVCYPYCLIRLPEGATKEYIGFTLTSLRDHKITLPDGFVFYEEADENGWSKIRFLL